MKKFLNTLFLLFGIYGIMATIFLFLDWLLTLFFTGLCLIMAFILLVFKRQKTILWQTSYSYKHPNWSPVLKVFGIYFLYIILSEIIFMTLLLYFKINPETINKVALNIGIVSQIIFAATLFGVILWRIITIIKQRRIAKD